MKLILCLVAAAFAFADQPTKVIYFGGFHATQEQVDCWKRGAAAQSDYAGYSFAAHPYPRGAGWRDASDVQSHAEGTIAEIVSEINAHPEMKFVIAGHSSASAISNRIAELVKNPKQVELVDLEGDFTPSKALQARVAKATCVYGASTKGVPSLEDAPMKACEHSLAYRDSRCKQNFCVHFSVVNKTPPENLNRDTYPKFGYQGCNTNLFWLPKRPAAAAPASRPGETSQISH